MSGESSNIVSVITAHAASIATRPEKSEVILAAIRDEIGPVTARRARNAMNRIVEELRKLANKGRWGRHAGTVIASYGFFGPAAVAIERGGALWDYRISGQSYGASLNLIAEHTYVNQQLPWLHQRIRFYQNLDSLIQNWRSAFDQYRFSLRKRDLGLAKFVVAGSELAFAGDLPERLGAELRKLKPAFQVHMQHREEFVSVAARLLREANEIRPIDLLDLGFSSAETLQNDVFRRLFDTAAIREILSEIGRMMQYLGYELHRDLTNGRTQYALRDASGSIERSLKDGTITSETQKMISMAEVASGGLLGLSDIADRCCEAMMQRGLIRVERAYEPFSRFRIEISAVPEVFDIPRQILHREQVLERSVIDRELGIESPTLDAVQLTSRLDMATFRKLHSHLRFFVCLYRSALLRSVGSDAEAFVNSLYFVGQRGQLATFLRELQAADDEMIRDFLDLLTWSSGANARHLDLQYTPIIAVDQEAVLLPRVLVASNAVRNTLVAFSKRPKESGDDFTRRVCGLFANNGLPVASEKTIRLRFGDEQEVVELDVLVLAEGVLYIFECKHTIQGTEAFELRPSWNHILEAVDQLRAAKDIFERDPNWKARLREWFPNIRPPEMKPVVKPCVMLSVRTFSGMQLEGVPVRDWFSLHNVVEDGTIRIGRRDDAGMHEHHYRFWRNAAFSIQDLDDYLSETSRFWVLRRAPIHAHVEKLLSVGVIDVVRETFVGRFHDDFEMLDQFMCDHGAVRSHETLQEAGKWAEELEHRLAEITDLIGIN